MATEKNYTPKGLSRRGRLLIISGVVALALIGFVVGLRAGVPSQRGWNDSIARSTSSATSNVIPALSYDEIGDGRLRELVNSMSWADRSAALRDKPGTPITDMASRRASLALRAGRRAFNGAPPTIPHQTQGITEASCVACHGQGLRIAERPARDLPHDHMSNCQQCHSPTAPAFLAELGGPLSTSSWRGIAAPQEGTRATPGAPPEVPHTLHMRNNCNACHGPYGWPGMQTSHPERRNCLQCHTPTKDGAHPGRASTSPLFIAPPKVR